MATLFGVPLKWISLVTLVVQNSALVLVMRYAQTLPGPRFLTSTAVVMSEVLKLAISLAVHIRDEGRTRRVTLRSLLDDFFGRDSDWAKMTVPAILYFIQNNLQYVAVHLLDAATFQVTYQMKIITTALFSVWLLAKPLSLLKWISLGILTFGIAVVQISGKKSPAPAPAAPASAASGEAAANLLATAATASPPADDSDPSGMGRFLGLVAVTIACILSGLAGVWQVLARSPVLFEKVLKGTKASLFLRNVQLSFFSVVSGLIFGVYLMDGAAVTENGFFYGYTIWAWAAILCQAIGGLIVAVVVKYADNILKGFATSIAIILSSVASVFIFDFVITTPFVIGAGLVLYATHLYSKPEVGNKIVSAKSDSHFIKLEAGEHR
ncbi:hypothetical protein HK105_207545 [Polyrhizophydium stewartii]|uniref:UDP-galactose transporter n=1 Tax=Polyrhizophydium stewartii TaxID=2732419 RepID=A0ABR4N0H0_9FUNG